MRKRMSIKPLTGTPVDTLRTVRSDLCMSVTVDDFATSQGGLQFSTGTTSFMNCLGLGHPFLTFNFDVNKHFLKRHNLKLDHFYSLPSSKREILVDTIKEFGSQLHVYPVNVGGVILSVARMTQWLLPQPKTVVILGARASDEDARTLVDLCRATRVGMRLEEKDKCSTSVLLILHMKTRWCEIYFTDKMPKVSTFYIDKPIVTKVMERANIIFTSDLSILLTPKLNKMVAYFAFSRFKHFLVIIHHSESLVDAKETVLDILSYADIVFLTPKSARKFMEIFNVPQKYSCCSCCRYAWEIYLWLKSFCKKSCTVIVSDGLKRAFVHTDRCNKKSVKYRSKIARNYRIVDYYGVSLAFVGGFMAMMMEGYQIDPCVECGFFCASLIVGQVGMTFPEPRDEVLSRWYGKLDNIMEKKNIVSYRKRESDFVFTIFQTPWKEIDVNVVLSDASAPIRHEDPSSNKGS